MGKDNGSNFKLLTAASNFIKQALTICKKKKCFKQYFCYVLTCFCIYFWLRIAGKTNGIE